MPLRGMILRTYDSILLNYFCHRVKPFLLRILHVVAQWDGAELLDDYISQECSALLPFLPSSLPPLVNTILVTKLKQHLQQSGLFAELGSKAIQLPVACYP